MKNYKPILILVILLTVAFAGTAQKKSRKKNHSGPDTLALLREFVSISNSYKQLPLYVDIDILNSSNFVTSAEDTTHVHAGFYISKENSYVRVGEFEQIVNDSSALLVSNRLRQMILYRDAGPVVKKMRGLMAGPLPDSSLQHLSSAYTASRPTTDSTAPVIELKSRKLLPGSSLPEQTISLKYVAATVRPEKVMMMKRELIALDSSEFMHLRYSGKFTDRLVALENRYYLVKEQTTSYIYNKIETGADITIPVTLADRVARNRNGTYHPVPAYTGYRLTDSN